MTIEIKSDVLDLSKKYDASIAKTGFVQGAVTVSEDTYFDNLTDGLTRDTIEKVRANDSLHNAAALHASGTQALNAFEKDGELTQVTTTLERGGKNSMTLVHKRHAHYPDLKDKTAPGTDKYCTSRLTGVHQEERTVGQIAAVCEELNKLGALALAKA